MDGGCDSAVGCKHELLDQLMALVLFHPDDFLCIAFLVDVDLGFRHIQFKASLIHPSCPHAAGDLPE